MSKRFIWKHFRDDLELFPFQLLFKFYKFWKNIDFMHYFLDSENYFCVSVLHLKCDWFFL